MKLTIELIPATQWGSNLRSALRPSRWDILRRAAYAKAGGVCEVCGGKGTEQGRAHDLEAHEIWEYEEETFTQRLLGLVALCPSCHRVKHMGRALSVGAGGLAMNWLAKVNGWNRDECEAYVAYAFAVQQIRSAHEWTLDLAWLFSDDSPFGIDDIIFK